MRIGDYIRTEYGISKIIDIKNVCGGKFIATDNNIGNVHYSNEYTGYVVDCLPNLWVKNHIKEKLIDLLKPMDLLYIDIDNGYAGGIIVPMIPETYCELKQIINEIKLGDYILKGVVTKEQLESMTYKVEVSNNE